MTEHLSESGIVEWIAGDRAPESARHLDACSECALRVERTAMALAEFHGALHAAAIPAPPSPAVVSAKTRPAFLTPLRIAFAAGLLAVVSIPWFHGRVPVSAPVSQTPMRQIDDAALLSQVDAGISRAVPGSMEPLVTLVDWNSEQTNK